MVWLYLAFRSLTMYQAQADETFFLADNPMGRYTIGNRTPGLITNEDGSLDVWIARSDPGGGRRANWLPAPAEDPFLVMMRTYLSGATIVAQTYTLPSIVHA